MNMIKITTQFDWSEYLQEMCFVRLFEYNRKKIKFNKYFTWPVVAITSKKKIKILMNDWNEI